MQHWGIIGGRESCRKEFGDGTCIMEFWMKMNQGYSCWEESKRELRTEKDQAWIINWKWKGYWIWDGSGMSSTSQALGMVTVLDQECYTTESVSWKWFKIPFGKIRNMPLKKRDWSLVHEYSLKDLGRKLRWWLSKHLCPRTNWLRR